MSFKEESVTEVHDANVPSDRSYDQTTQPEERSMKQAQLHLDTIERQKEYVAKQKAKGGGVGVVFQDAFIRGMRDLGYKDPAWALAELIDNSVQAGANTVEIRFGFDKGNTTQAKNPSHIAIIDNGTGMDSEMIGYAVRWGGTDREDDRNGFGRFGYGLPSSCVSIACKYTVYSKTEGGEWHSVHIDLEKLAAASSDQKATEAMLKPQRAQLPAWVAASAKEGACTLQAGTLDSGTVIVLEDLDRLRGMSGWIAVKALRARLLQQFGVIYRHWIPEVRICVDNEQCQAVDPLFLLPHAMYVDETSLKAKKIDQRAIEVEAVNREGQKVKGMVKIRAACLPLRFSWPDPENISFAGRSASKNKRFEQVLAPTKGLNGILICREGRQIDVVQPQWVKFQNYDVYIKIEIDFDPVLDELFSITTSKQQIRIDDDLWQKLIADGKNAGGLKSLVQDLRAQLKEEKEQIDALVANMTKQTATELPAANAMVEAEKFKTKTPLVTKETREEAERNLVQEVVARVKETGHSEDEVRTQIEAEIKKRPWDIEFKAIEEGPFFIPKRMGQQKRILLNTAHPFYSRLYAKASGEVTAALEVLLFVLADGEIEALAAGQRATFYKSERHHWSELLSHALASLVPQSSLDDEASLEMDLDEQARASPK
jgi:Histidine kinase-, DNA gyrase B-, and HSP90-like ATPase